MLTPTTKCLDLSCNSCICLYYLHIAQNICCCCYFFALKIKLNSAKYYTSQRSLHDIQVLDNAQTESLPVSNNKKKEGICLKKQNYFSCELCTLLTFPLNFKVSYIKNPGNSL